MVLKIHVSDEETVEIPVSSIKRVDLMYYDIVQITLHDNSVKELHFLPVETAAEQAKKVCVILNGSIDINASFIKQLN